MEDWARKRYAVDGSSEETLQANAQALGQVELYDKLATLTYEDILATRKEIDELKRIWYSPDGITGVSLDGQGIEQTGATGPN